MTLVDKYGPRRWSLIASSLPGRIGKQCRERWYNQLDPSINTLPWTDSEDLILIQAHQAVTDSHHSNPLLSTVNLSFASSADQGNFSIPPSPLLSATNAPLSFKQ